MFSQLRKGLVYTDTSPDILEHDEDIDADLWMYDDRDVYRGTFDPRYTEHNLKVYWLYDDSLNRVGLAEHEMDEHQIYKVLWFHDNPFATLYQNPEWKSEEKTIWSMMSNEAYQDCLDDDFKTIFDRCLSSKYRLVTPSMLISPPSIYECKKCGKQSVSKFTCSNVIEKPYFTDNLIFVDESMVIYKSPTVRHASDEREQPEQLQPQQADLPESPVEEPRLEPSPSPLPPQESPPRPS